MTGAPASRALLMALELLKNPALGEVVRRQDELPEGVLTVVRIAGGCGETVRHAAQALGKPEGLLVKASRFYVQQALFYPGATSYRILGLNPHSPQEDVREHMRWLMRWLHPDRAEGEWEASYGYRVATAWNDLKSPEKRSLYDRDMKAGERKPLRGTSRGRRTAPPLYWSVASTDNRHRRTLVHATLAIVTYLAVWFIPFDYRMAEPDRPGAALEVSVSPPR